MVRDHTAIALNFIIICALTTLESSSLSFETSISVSKVQDAGRSLWPYWSLRGKLATRKLV